MSRIENNLDTASPATPGHERVTASLSAPKPRPPVQQSGHPTLDKLLGASKLTAYDASGNDPYNATGRQFRR